MSYALTCDICDEVVPYRSCQQPDTDAIAELALIGHKMLAHQQGEITPDDVGRAVAQIFDVRDSAGYD